MYFCPEIQWRRSGKSIYPCRTVAWMWSLLRKNLENWENLEGLEINVYYSILHSSWSSASWWCWWWWWWRWWAARARSGCSSFSVASVVAAAAAVALLLAADEPSSRGWWSPFVVVCSGAISLALYQCGTVVCRERLGRTAAAPFVLFFFLNHVSATNWGQSINRRISLQHYM